MPVPEIDWVGLSDEDLWEVGQAHAAETDRRTRVAVLPEQIQAEIDTYEAAVAEESPLIWEDILPTQGIGPGVRVVFTDGETYRNKSRGWLNILASPVTYPWGWEQETGLPDPDPDPGTPEWQIGASYHVGDRVVWKGVLYECTYATVGAPGGAPDSPAMWAVWKARP